MKDHKRALDYLVHLARCYHMEARPLGSDDEITECESDLNVIVQKYREPQQLIQIWKTGVDYPYYCPDCYKEIPLKMLGDWHYCPYCGQPFGKEIERP